MKRLLIIGIDPGTTTGYAVLDIEGNIVEISSEKELGLSELISRIIKLGTPVAVCCDVTPAPEIVEKFSARFGCRLIVPEKDLLVREKDEIIRDFKDKCEGSHQKDALASALFAYSELKQIIEKAKFRLANLGKQNILYDVLDIVIAKELSIQSALDLIEKPEKEEVQIIKKVSEKQLFKSDFLKLYEKISSLESEISLLRKQNQRLSAESEKSGKKEKYLLEKYDLLIPKEKVKTLLLNKDILISRLNSEIENRNKKIKSLNEEISRITGFVMNIKDKYLLKKLSNLGSREFEMKKKLLGISEGDILLVDDLDIFSENVVNELKPKVELVVFKKAGKKVVSELPFVAIPADKLNLVEEELFAFADKAQFDEVKSKHNLLGKIVSEYKKGRI